MANWLQGNLARADRASDSLAKGFQARFAGGESLKDSMFKLGDYGFQAGQNDASRQLQRDMPYLTADAAYIEQAKKDALKALKMGLDDPLEGNPLKEDERRVAPGFYQQFIDSITGPKKEVATAPNRPAKEILAETGAIPADIYKEPTIEDYYLQNPVPDISREQRGTSIDAGGKYPNKAAEAGKTWKDYDYIDDQGNRMTAAEYYKKNGENLIPPGWKMQSKDYKEEQEDFAGIRELPAKTYEEYMAELKGEAPAKEATSAIKSISGVEKTPVKENRWAGYAVAENYQASAEKAAEQSVTERYPNLSKGSPEYERLFMRTLKGYPPIDFSQGYKDQDKNDASTMIDYVMHMKDVAAQELPNLWNPDGTPIKGYEEEAYKEAAKIMTKRFPGAFNIDSFDRENWNVWLKTINPTDESTWGEALPYFESLIKNPYSIGQEVATSGDASRGVLETLPLFFAPGLMFVAGVGIADQVTGKKVDSVAAFEEWASLSGRRAILNATGVYTYQHMLAKAKKEAAEKNKGTIIDNQKGFQSKPILPMTGSPFSDIQKNYRGK